jgi:ferredoxin-NADP reductase
VAVAQKLACTVERIVNHGERVYTVVLRPERPAPRFRAGQFLHLALDPYEATSFWPESRAFSIATSPTERDRLHITYSVRGRFTARMESDLAEGGDVWVKMPFGEFVIDGGTDVVLFAGGTGISAFTAFLEQLPANASPSVTLAYGARTADLLIYRDVVERCARRVGSLRPVYFVEEPAVDDARQSAFDVRRGRISVAAVWPQLVAPFASAYYISGPPPMLQAVAANLQAQHIPPEAIHIDAWE